MQITPCQNINLTCAEKRGKLLFLHIVNNLKLALEKILTTPRKQKVIQNLYLLNISRLEQNYEKNFIFFNSLNFNSLYHDQQLFS